MGICSNAKEIIYYKNISDIPVNNNNNNNNEEIKLYNNHSLNGTAQKSNIK